MFEHAMSIAPPRAAVVSTKDELDTVTLQRSFPFRDTTPPFPFTLWPQKLEL